ncbi:uncharacterized protein A1O9_06839 [Exophiala aquamarina CBS 119918]|uniref:NADP-dependent oxidoreductase domain-containing protein n=1 Tax=Exophiala aquamarina CBS 119918 TaxID=1182545 RepID=A0A072PM95_9EURO|nr:uncharacterized protein A1O9_06839 [Exophiala aquamarina CBS 119918]KEF56650.1 hypothetical protein A1O9_06839 [Exophiala aquamarina CBS 119918]
MAKAAIRNASWRSTGLPTGVFQAVRALKLPRGRNPECSNYNPVARLQETLLFPTLRKLGIVFYAYSSLAGCFLTKTAADIKQGKGRLNNQVIDVLCKEPYAKPTYVDALEKWEAAAAAEGVTQAVLANQWVVFNPLLKKERGDGIVIGVSNNEQLEQTLAHLKKGHLRDQAMKAIDDIWEAIKHEAPYDNTHRMLP